MKKFHPKMHPLVISLLVIILTLSVNLYAQKQDLKFKHLVPDDGLSYSNVQCILMDRKGFMWFGTADGLNKFDGHTIKVYRHDADDPHSLSSNYINVMLEDRRGHLWIGTLGGGLNLYDRDNDHFIHYPQEDTDGTSWGFNYIEALIEDHKGQLWLGTDRGGLTCFDPEKKTFIHYKKQANNPNSLSHNDVWAICEDRNHQLWVGTLGGGLDLFDPETGTFTHYRHDPNDPTSLSHNEVWTIHEDRRGNLWIGTFGGGLNLYDRDNNQFLHYKHHSNDPTSLACNVVFSIFEDSQGNLWVGTETGGLNLLDRESGTFVHYLNDVYDPSSLSHNTVECIYEDRYGTLWIGTYNGGVNFFNKYSNKFAHYKQILGKNSLSNNVVLSFYEDQNGQIWIGTDGGGLNLFDREHESFIHFRHKANDPRSLSNDVVLSLYEDRKGYLWVGTYAGGLNRFDRKSGTFVHYQHDVNDPHSLSSNDVRAIYEDSQGNLWIGTHLGGLNRFDRAKGTFIHYQHDDANPYSISNDYIYSILEDSKGMLWLGSPNGGLNCYDREKEIFIHYTHDENNDSSLSHNGIFSMLEDSQGRLWIGTGDGLDRFNRETKSFTHFRIKDGNIINGILEDNQGHLWLSTNNGLSKFNPRTKTFRDYDIGDGLQSNQFKNGACLKTRKGEMFFGGIKGFNVFFPDSIKDNPHVPPVTITDFRIFNKPVTIGGEDSPLAKHISETKEMTLSYNQSVFSFEFAALNFISPEKNQYAYKLEGFDKDWTYSGSKWTATYTNLDPGKYIFKVKGSNNDGVWNEQGTSLKIIITPPFWQTWWFRVAGSIALLALIVTVHRIRTVAIRERNKQLEEINTRLNKQIAARQRVEELVRTQKEYFEALFNSAPEAIASLDMNQHIVTVNPQFEALFGYSLDEIKGKHIDELIVPRDKLAESEEITTRVLQGDVAKIESIRRRKDGSLVHVTVGGAPVVVEGKQVGVYAVYVDITERKLLEGKLKEHSEQLEKINSKLRREMTEKEDFLRAVSHDLGAPLRNIAGMAASLIRKYGPCLNQEVKHRLERIQSNAVKEMQLIQELLELSRIKTQREKFEAVNLQTLIQNIKEMFEYQLEERAITLTLHNPLPTIYCEKNRIKQVFQNLIDNAIKYMGNEEHPQIEIGSDEENSRFIFWVKDNGIGIKKENQQRIFHIFRRGEGQAVAKVEGKGIGLATVKSIVENYDGEIWVESEEGKGSTFYFTLSKEIVTPKLEVIKDGP